jgi:hypothetical protein
MTEDKSSLRGRPKSPAAMMEDALRNGAVKSEDFLSGIDDLERMGGSPKLLSGLLRNGLRQHWLRGNSVRLAIVKIERLEGERLDGPEGSPAPRTRKGKPDSALSDLLSPERFEEWNADERRRHEEFERSLDRAPKPSPVPSPMEQEIESQQVRAKLEEMVSESACVDSAAFNLYRRIRRDGLEGSIAYMLPDGRLIYADGTEFSSDPWALKISTRIAVKEPPEAGMRLSEENETVRWIRKAAPPKPEPQGLELWAKEPVPKPEFDRHQDARHERKYEPFDIPVEYRPSYSPIVRFRN